MASIGKWLGYSAPDTVIVGTSLNALADGAYALGPVIDNTGSGSPDLRLYGDFELILPSAVTAGSGSPYVGIYLLPAMDGTNYPTPPGGSAGAAPASYLVGSILANPSASFTVGHYRGAPLSPCALKIMIQNKLGVAFPASNSISLKLYRYTEQAV